MAQIGFGVPNIGTLADALQAIPDDFRSYFKGGFAQLAASDPKSWGSIARIAETSGLSPPSNLVLDALGPSEESHALVTSVRLLFGLLGLRDETVAEFAEEAVKAGILESRHTDVVLRFAEQFAGDKNSLRQKLGHSELQTGLLPLLTVFDVAIDLRIGFEGGKAATAAPVALIHIDTDSTDKELWLQMTPAQVEALAAKLAETVAKLRQAEQLAQKLLR